MKLKKKFLYKDIELRVVEVEEKYMNSVHTITVTRVIAPNGGTIPLYMRSKQTLKSIMEETIILLDSFSERGADVKAELTKKLPIQS